MRLKLLLALVGSLATLAPVHAALYNPPPPPLGRHMPSSFAGHRRFAPGHLLVRLRPCADAARFYRETGLKRLRRIAQINVDVVTVPAGQEKALARSLSARPDVVYAEPDGVAVALSVPNDPLFAAYQWYLPQIQLPAAWDISTGSPDVTIAILDTGVDANHPDLHNKVVPGYNAIDGTADTSDGEGHGTHVAGLAGASSNNGVGIAGVNWGARIMPIAVLGPSGEGTNSVIADGLIWAADHGARIFNLSLGSPEFNSTLSDAVRYVQGKNGLIVAAAGNDYLSSNPVTYPAALKGVIAVGASNSQSKRSSYSEAGSYLSVVAPGGDPYSDSDSDPSHWIVSTWRIAEAGYQELAGTSQATPLVSGLAALLWSVRPDATADQIRNAIQNTATDLGAPGWDAETGYGQANAQAALASLGPPPASDLTPPRLSLTYPVDGAIVAGTVSIDGSARDDVGLQSYEVQYGIGEQPAQWFSLGGPRSQPVDSGELATWDTSGLADGVYSIRATASDLAGHTTAAGPIHVVIDNTPPTLVVTSPAEGQTVFSAAVPIAGTLTDAHTSTVAVSIGAGTDPDQWSDLGQQGVDAGMVNATFAQLDMAGRDPGAYSLLLVVTDAAGNAAKTEVHITYTAGLPGDVNGDGRIDVTDAIAVMRMAIGIPSDDDPALADVSPVPGTGGRPYGDGKITVADSVRILRRALNLEPDPWPG